MTDSVLLKKNRKMKIANSMNAIRLHGVQLLLSTLLAAMIMGCNTQKPSTTQSANFIAPDYVKKDYKKILVICRIDPETYRKRIEKGIVSELNDHRYNAGPAYEFVTQDLIRDSLKLRSTVETKGYDAAILLTYLGQMTSVQDQYTLNGNMYSVLAGSYPVVDLETSAQKIAYFQADFFIAGKRGTQWRSNVRAKLGRDLDIATQQMAMELRKKMQADRIF